MAFGWDDAISIGSSVLGFLGQEETNAANAQQASQQMDFQREMSSTAYQRATADMKAAGLNPMLAYSQGGATTPGGAMATMQNSTASAAANASQALQQRQTIAATDNTRADTALKNSQALVNQATVPKIVQDTLTGGHSASQIEQMVRRLREENDLGWSGESIRELRLRGTKALFSGQRDDIEGRIAEQRAEGMYGQWEAEAMRALARSRSASAALDEMDFSRARRERDVNESGYGAVRPFLKDISSLANSAASARRMGLRR